MAQTKGTTRGRAGKLKSFNPCTGETLAEIRANTAGEVADIVTAARKVAPEWAGIPPQGRARILKEVRHSIYDHMDAIVETVSAECGKPRTEALTHDVLPTVLTLLYYERTAARQLRSERVGGIVGPALGVAARVDWRPFGVVGCITPWNYPFFLAFMAIAPALFAGNTVVLKPSEVTPQVGERIREVLEPLPAGVVTVIQGGARVGGALVDAPCDKICFVGSPATGRKIAQTAAKHLTPVVMELGGQDAAIVCEDADLDVSTSGVLWSAFFNAGQTCSSIERVYVTESNATEFREQLLAKVVRLRQGHGDVDVGSLTFKPQLETVQRHVSDAVAKGATVLAGGDGTKSGDGTLFYPPTVIEGVNDDMDVMKEETFGPVLPIITVQDEAEAVRRANEDGFNLTASVWTSSKKKGESIAARLRAGTVTINGHGETGGAPWTPWGGVGESGYGRLQGTAGLREFVVPTTVARNLTPKMKRLWWYPYDEATNDVAGAAARMLSAPSWSQKLTEFQTVARQAGRAIRSKL
jgi:succinate-semialdehyde dehydrogenase/glutarate-semialdehyde dehydrogenase